MSKQYQTCLEVKITSDLYRNESRVEDGTIIVTYRTMGNTSPSADRGYDLARLVIEPTGEESDHEERPAHNVQIAKICDSRGVFSASLKTTSGFEFSLETLASRDTWRANTIIDDFDAAFLVAYFLRRNLAPRAAAQQATDGTFSTEGMSDDILKLIAAKPAAKSKTSKKNSK